MNTAKPKRFIAFKEITMTKVIAMTFIIPWLIVLIMQVIYLWSNKTIGGDLDSVLSSSGAIVAVVASGYFARSGYDTYTRSRYSTDGLKGYSDYKGGLQI